MKLLLIGYRGTGKSAVAQQLGLSLGWDWIDADVELELRAGKSIAAIFADEGEAAFRDLETAVLTDLVRRDKTVLALGGGAVLRPENRKLLSSAGTVVWLQAELETIRRRLAEDPTTASRRPPLTVGPGDEIRELLAVREPLYRECADLIVDTEQKSPSQIAAEIVARVRSST